MVGGRGELLLARTHLKGERALRSLREELVRLEATADLGREAEPVEAAGGEHDGIQPALDALAQARVDVAAQRLNRERGLEREQLRAPPHRGSADPHPRPQLSRAAERVARVVAL